MESAVQRVKDAVADDMRRPAAPPRPSVAAYAVPYTTYRESDFFMAPARRAPLPIAVGILDVGRDRFEVDLWSRRSSILDWAHATRNDAHTAALNRLRSMLPLSAALRASEHDGVVVSPQRLGVTRLARLDAYFTLLGFTRTPPDLYVGGVEPLEESSANRDPDRNGSAGLTRLGERSLPPRRRPSLGAPRIAPTTEVRRASSRQAHLHTSRPSHPLSGGSADAGRRSGRTRAPARRTNRASAASDPASEAHVGAASRCRRPWRVQLETPGAYRARAELGGSVGR